MSSLCYTMPGDVVTGYVESKLEERAELKKDSLLSKRSSMQDEPPVVKLGQGLLQLDNEIVAIQAGHLVFQGPNRFYIVGHRRRYVPAVGDLVVGIVTAKLAELYRVDIGAHMNAALPLAGFEGVTKKNKPNLDVGSVVYARVLVANKDMEPELVCIDSDNKGDGFGEIRPGGLLTRCSCSLSQALQKANCQILEHIGKHLAYEIIVGANGRFIVNADKMQEVVAITNAILQSEFVDPSIYRVIIKEMMTGLPSKY